jgi:hypothetical protein
MNLSDSIPGGTILNHIEQGGVEAAIGPIMAIQYQVEWSGPRTAIPSRPVLEGVAPETPKLWGARGDLGPVMANEEEVMGSLLQPAKFTLEGDIPTENIAKYFGWELGNVQQRVPSAFELDQGPLMLSDLFIQNQYGFDVDLAATLPVSNWIRS